MALSEFELIDRFFTRIDAGVVERSEPDAVSTANSVAVGIGDDCAVLSLASGERMAVSVDTLVEGVHFLPAIHPADLAWRAVAVAASDLAAMGARPVAMTLALTLPQVDAGWLADFRSGLVDVSRFCALPLVGGDTTRGPLTLSVQVMGALPQDKSLLRRGAKVGDRVVVSGCLGDGGAALALLKGQWQTTPEHQQYLRQRFFRPHPQLVLGQQLLHCAHSAIDISDGLLADVGHIARASGVGIELEATSVPLSDALLSHPDRQQALAWALRGGDDYQLCYTLAESVKLPQGSYIVGRVVAGSGVRCDDGSDRAAGYRHF